MCTGCPPRWKIGPSLHAAVRNVSTASSVWDALRGEQWTCDFRNASVVKLSILDLASFRADGRVRVDEGHSAPDHLLAGQQKVYADRTAEPSAALTAAVKLDTGATINMAFSSADAFRHIHTAVFEAATKTRANKQTIERPKRVTKVVSREFCKIASA